MSVAALVLYPVILLDHKMFQLGRQTRAISSIFLANNRPLYSISKFNISQSSNPGVV